MNWDWELGTNLFPLGFLLWLPSPSQGEMLNLCALTMPRSLQRLLWDIKIFSVWPWLDGAWTIWKEALVFNHFFVLCPSRGVDTRTTCWINKWIKERIWKREQADNLECIDIVGLFKAGDSSGIKNTGTRPFPQLGGKWKKEAEEKSCWRQVGKPEKRESCKPNRKW